MNKVTELEGKSAWGRASFRNLRRGKGINEVLSGSYNFNNYIKSKPGFMLLKTPIVFLLLLLCFSACQSVDQSNPIDIDLSELTVAEIHQAFEAGTYDSQDLVKAYQAAIESTNEKLNALTYINPEALSSAKELDEEYQKTGKLRPLHGIPIIVKDNINTKGLPTTAGALALRDFIPEEDAFIIKKLEAAGAIIVAKSNMAEWAFSPMHSESSTHGTTRNPYSLEHVPAGSSGGTAAAIAANLGAIGLGTDTGNSIRGPSAHCALVGFRTSLGLISREGIVPLYLRNDVVGPMCRSVEDATRVMEVMAGYDSKDPITKHSEGKTPNNYTQFLKEDGLEGARIGVFRQLSDEGVDPEIKGLFEGALSDLQDLGAELVDPVIIPNFSELRQNQWCSTFRKDVEDFLRTYVQRDTMQSLEDIIRVGTKSEFASRRLERFANFEGRWDYPEEECLNAYEDPRRIAYREAIEKVMDSLNLDALVYPSWNRKPARIASFEKDYAGDNSQVIAPHTGQPAFTVPMGFTEGKFPAGLQFLGRMYGEGTLVSLTYAYEQGTQHRKAPPLMDAKD